MPRRSHHALLKKHFPSTGWNGVSIIKILVLLYLYSIQKQSYRGAPEGVLKIFSKFTRKHLYWDLSNAPKATFLMKRLRHSDVRLGYRYASVLPPGLKSIFKDFFLWKSVIKIATVLYYHHRLIIQRDKIEQQQHWLRNWVELK